MPGLGRGVSLVELTLTVFFPMPITNASSACSSHSGRRQGAVATGLTIRPMYPMALEDLAARLGDRTATSASGSPRQWGAHGSRERPTVGCPTAETGPRGRLPTDRPSRM